MRDVGRGQTKANKFSRDCRLKCNRIPRVAKEALHPGSFGYTWFCTTFAAWKQRARPSMRQTHIGGEKVFVDFAGDTIDIFDLITGEVRAMKLFVAAMGASN